jgi:glycosyltransferase involved in cell wall biosynthesis
MKKLLIVEEALKSADGGHWYEMMRSIVGACPAAGIEPTIAAHRDVSPAIRDELRALPAMPCSAWDGAYASANPLKRYAGVFAHNLRLYHAVKKILAAGDGFDCVFAPTILVHHVLGWLWIARRFGGRKFGHLTLLCVNPPGRYDENGVLHFPRSSVLFKKALQSFAPLMRSGLVTLAVETRRTGEHFKQFCGFDFRVLPQPVAMPEVKTPAPATNGSVTFGSFGFARYEQGTDLLLAAAQRVLAGQPDAHARFIVRWARDFTGPDGEIVRREPALLQNPSIEFIGSARSPDEYLAQLARADAVVLPYRRESYRDRLSRVAIEAAALGIPIACTRDTWLEELVSHCGAGVAFREQDADDIARAVRELVANISEYKAKARKNAAKAREYFSAQRFVGRLFDTSRAESGAVF